MKISEQWLREWVTDAGSLDEIAERLTMAGLEVDAVEDAAPRLKGVVIGRVTQCEPHPSADRLSVCRVDIGTAETLAIVCGAPNVAAGARVPVATVGATLPGGMKIKKAKLRGEPSHGMLCSAAELGLSSDASGLWLLPDDAPVGEALEDYLGLPDRVLDIDLTPNRGDCLSLRGVAREVAVAAGVDFEMPAVEAPVAAIDTQRAVTIDAPERCAAYAARCIDGIEAGAATPVWMRERLRRAGIRQISLPVDIGNYVMLELGQPMHAFDADKLDGDIHVRLAHAGERIVTLDDAEVELAADTLVIADAQGAVAIAGMIGGKRTAVDANTTRVVFESACFTPAAVAGQGRRYKIHTDSLHRFERGVDPELHPLALDRATQLLLTLGGGQAGPGRAVHGQPVWPDQRRIGLRAERVERLLGEALPGEVIEKMLTSLGLSVTVERAGSEWTAEPPSWRYDINIEADLVEEVARVYGYDRLQAYDHGVALPALSGRLVDAAQNEPDHALLERGYSEAITYSFVEPALHAQLTGSAAAIALDNPIAEQFMEMRRTLWASLLPSWAHNVRRQQTTVRLFEKGLRFVPEPKAEHGIRQQPMVAGLASGLAHDIHWDRPARELDFFDIKGDVEALFGPRCGRLTFEAARHPALHPGRAARILLDGEPVGWLGQLSPSFKNRYKNSMMPYVFEVEHQALVAKEAIHFEPVSEQPSVRRDLAVVVAESVEVGRLVAAIESVEAPALQRIVVFDVFRGEGLETGFKSVALGLIFQDKASTLTDENVDTIITRVISALSTQCDARIRGE